MCLRVCCLNSGVVRHCDFACDLGLINCFVLGVC